MFVEFVHFAIFTIKEMSSSINVVLDGESS